ncbi:uncharacterized protein LOC117302190 [Asterias rubens]|uniref:uncharacterized protein LOC117302190 n=1 Tax=Asterias rubens TaxID=7604 RepID=UPI0014559E37|nr:uncharacterized protein LOC117302190 [Asterias rubens]
MSEVFEIFEPGLVVKIGEREEIVPESQVEFEVVEIEEDITVPHHHHHEERPTGDGDGTNEIIIIEETAAASIIDIETTSDSSPSPTPENQEDSKQFSTKSRPAKHRGDKRVKSRTKQIRAENVSKRKSKRTKTTPLPVVKEKVTRKMRQSAKAKLKKEKTRKANLYLRKGLDNPTSAPSVADIPEAQRIKCGLEEFQSGKFKTVTAAAAYWRVHAGKLYRRSKAEVPMTTQHGPAPVLTEEEEQDLANWVLTMSEGGFQVPAVLLRDAVQSFFKRDNSPFINGRPSYRWYYSFLRRHPKLKEMKTSNLALLCDAAPTKRGLDEWFRELKSLLIKLDIVDKPSQIFNYAETTFEIDKKTSKIVVFAEPFVCLAVGRRRATVGMCASADGHLLPPFIIYRYRGMCHKTNQWDPLDGASKGSGVIILERDGKKQDAFSSWLEWHFVKNLGNARPVVLLLSCQHNSIPYEAYVTARKNDVYLFRVPTKAMSLVQPLDIGEDGPFRMAWLTKWTTQNQWLPVRTDNVAHVISSAWKEADNSEAIRSCFIQSGVYPLDREMVDDAHLPDKILNSPERNPPKYKEPVQGDDDQEKHLSTSATSSNVAEIVFKKLDDKLDKTTRETYRTCIESGLDLEETPLFSVWKKLYKEAYHTESKSTWKFSKSGKSSRRRGRKQSPRRRKRSSKHSKDEVYCPVCEEEYWEDGEDWIGCDGQCQSWYHINCLPPEVVTPALLEDKEMVCPKCVHS